MILAHTRAELTAALEKLSGPVVLVPTMGALHDGHRALIRHARALAGDDSAIRGDDPPKPPREKGSSAIRGDAPPKPLGQKGSVVISVFVNPLQFGPTEDLDRYPRTLPADLAIAEAEHADLVFAPGVADMYPNEQLVMVDPGSAGDVLEGEFRPGFFKGVLTVVLKLFTLVHPDIAVFGEKDAQQLALVRRMAADFALGIEIVGVPTVRAADGLALSSRNKYLSSAQRSLAPALHDALAAGAAAASGGPREVRETALRALEATGDAFAVDYVEVMDQQSATVVRDDGFRGAGVLAVAARLGSTRLIDNVPVRFDAADD
ncbi:MAG TPA: pantoate--beta-alanine ligase [Trebonia sp.]|jgi:pantoate--beta-alanine ligase|nr:pantoate--beta-alanine ligase [Trebonia sp.]